jgi:hypothetical protein
MAMHRALKNLRSTKSAGLLEGIAAIPGSKENLAFWKGYQLGVKEAIETMHKEIKLIQEEEVQKLLGEEDKGNNGSCT